MTVAVVTGDGRLRYAGKLMRVAFGRGGIRVHKQEGDGATPAGYLPIRRVLYRADRVAIPRSSLPREPIGERDGWCDDPSDRAYNQPIQLPHSARHEALWRRDGLYDLIGVLGWNDAPVVRDNGSAIFLHVARPDYDPTEGCLALELADLHALLADGITAIDVRV